MRTREFGITSTGLNKNTVAVATGNTDPKNVVNFLDELMCNLGHYISQDNNKDVGQITVSANTFTGIALLNDEVFVKMAHTALEVVIGNMTGFDEGTGTYYGLFVEDIITDAIHMDYVEVSELQEQHIITEMLNCDLYNIKNLRKIFSDINELFRMYQELTIDAAKKLYRVAAVLYSNVLKANSTIHIDHNFSSFKDVSEFGIRRLYDFASDEGLGVPHYSYKDDGSIKKVTFTDPISLVQDTVSAGLVDLIKKDAKKSYDDIKLSSVVEDSFGLGGEFANLAIDMYEMIRKPYGKAIHELHDGTKKLKDALSKHAISEFAYNKGVDHLDASYKAKIEDLSKYAIHMTSGLSPATAGRLMFMVSNIERKGQSWVVDQDSTCQMFLAVAPKLFFAYVLSEHAEIKDCGYKLLGDTSELVEGQELTFANGNALNATNVFVDSIYNGTLTVKTVNGVLCAVKPIEVKVEDEGTPALTVMSVWKNSIIDVDYFLKTRVVIQTKNFSTLEDQQVFNRAKKIQLVPSFKYIDAQGKDRFVFNAVVATIADLDDPTIYVQVPIGQYLCKSAKFEKLIAGLTSEKLMYKIDQSNLRLCFTNTYFEQVDLNLAKDINDEDLNTEFDIEALLEKISQKEANACANDPFADTSSSQGSTSTENPTMDDQDIPLGCYEDSDADVDDEMFKSTASLFDEMNFDLI